jgi:hypothetical protein
MKQRPRLVWTPRADTPAPEAAPATAAVAPRLAFIPSVGGAATPLEDAIGLLQVAAEVEHALLVQYLYAAASVVSNTPNMRAKITTVAIQEMGHMVTVQNLLLAVGARENHHFGRDVLRAQSQFDPIPLVLEPLNHTSIAKYVVVEQPAVIDDAALRARVDDLEQEVLLAENFDPRRVGELYAAIYWLMQPSDAPFGPLALSVNDGFRSGWHVGPADFRPAAEINNFATVLAEWNNFPDLVVDVVLDPASACDALYRVMAQGEGMGSQPDAHFEEFVELLDAFDAGQIKIAPLPRSPYVAGQAVPGDPRAVQLTHTYTVAWGRLFNQVYTHVILCLGHALFLPVGDAVRDGLRAAALSGMRPLLRSLSNHMRTLRIDSTSTAVAGPTYGLLTEDLPATADEFWTAQRQSLDAEDAIVADIAAHPDHAADLAGKTALLVLTQFQKAIRALLP